MYWFLKGLTLVLQHVNDAIKCSQRNFKKGKKEFFGQKLFYKMHKKFMCILLHN
jgi:hypothetical protein